MAAISGTGRFSSQMLTYLGTQRTVSISNGYTGNVYKYATGEVVYPAPATVYQAYAAAGVVGNYSPDSYDMTKCYFISRGASVVHAETMAALTIDASASLGITPQAFLQSTNNKLSLSSAGYVAINYFRAPGNQIGASITPSNKDSLQARAIRG